MNDLSLLSQLHCGNINGEFTSWSSGNAAILSPFQMIPGLFGVKSKTVLRYFPLFCSGFCDWTLGLNGYGGALCILMTAVRIPWLFVMELRKQNASHFLTTTSLESTPKIYYTIVAVPVYQQEQWERGTITQSGAVICRKTCTLKKKQKKNNESDTPVRD